MSEQQEKELQRLAILAERTFPGAERDLRVADLLAFIGVIHDTAPAKSDWINRHDRHD